jgi:nitrogen fixation NifU-like protein
MTVSSIAIAVAVLTVVVFFWFGMHYYFHPRMENPDARAVITGPCGDTMEIALKFMEARVAETHYWTNGCSISRMCVETAGELAKGKTVSELKQITMDSIMEKTGKLPETHLHCARLAEMTLQKAVENYTNKTPHA